MLKFDRFHKIDYCIDASIGLICYKNPSLGGDKYIYEAHELHDLYTSALLMDHHPNNPPTLEEIITNYLCTFYQPGQKAG